MLGTRLGPYEILAPLGAGGMGEVYRARDARLDREVAIKVLPRHLLDSPDALARFEREARAVAALNHPNILAIHDIGRDGPISYAVTEMLEGDTLRARMAAGPIPPRRALDILAQIARGLGAAHDRGIVHRDIKPDNLFLTTDGRVKILDFGVATRSEAEASADVTTAALTEPGMLVGTPAYMAPEQLLTQTATARSDLFAFGLVAHEMLTGSHPFKRATAGETTIAILREDPAPVGQAAAALPAGVAPALARCLEKQPADRPASARDLAFYLETLGRVADHAFEHPEELRADQVPRVRRRVLIASVVLLLLVVLLTWGYAGVMADRVVNGAINTDLARAERLARRVQEERLTRLSLQAQLLASSPALKASFGTDSATVRDLLLNYQGSTPGMPLLIALLPDGRVMARTDTPTPAAGAPGDTWVDRLLAQSAGAAVVGIDGRLYHAAAAESEAGGTRFGHVIVATPIDETFAQSLSEATQDEIVLLASGLLGSTLRGSQTPWRSLQEWRERGGHENSALEVDIGAQRFAAREVSLSDQPALAAIVAKSRDEIVEPFKRIQSGLLVIGVVCALVAIAGSFWVAGRAQRR